jgi:hypothetical protein
LQIEISYEISVKVFIGKLPQRLQRERKNEPHDAESANGPSRTVETRTEKENKGCAKRNKAHNDTRDYAH